jgi:RecA-family ATPase
MDNNLNEVQKQVNQNDRFNIMSIDQFNKRPPMAWRIKNVLPAQGLAIMYGKSGTGKTFLLLDLLLAIATSDEWFGHSINKASVCYVCLEGASGVHQRLAAWEKASGRPLPKNFKIVTDPLDLTKTVHIHELANSIKEAEFGSGVIAIDTLNAATPRMDENSSKEMGGAISNLKLLMTLTNSLVLTSHHTGKDENRGMRGHSSLLGAIDVEIYLKSTNSSRTWTLDKIRDYENGETHSFKLVIHELDTDEDGEIITSCSIESDTPAPLGIRKPRGQNQILVFNQVHSLIEEETKNAGLPCGIGLDNAIDHAAIVLHKIDRHKRKNEATKILRNLISKYYFSSRIDNGIEYIHLS